MDQPAPLTRHLLLVGSFGVITGVAQVNLQYARAFKAAGWTVSVLAVDMTGDPHDLHREFTCYPAHLGGDTRGLNRLRNLVDVLRPDVVLIHDDTWHIAEYLTTLRDLVDDQRPVIVALTHPDGENQVCAPRLRQARRVIVPSAFGRTVLEASGYVGPIDVLPYGVDARFVPRHKPSARAALRLPAEGFVVGRADRNQPRKRYDLTLAYWAEWWTLHNQPTDAWLYLHCAPRDLGWDLPQLAHYYGIESRVVFVKDHRPDVGAGDMVDVYNSWDVHFSTTAGEGFGLVALESMACGVPQILPQASAYADWAASGATLVPCDATAVTTGGVNTIGSLMAKDPAVRALADAYAAWQRDMAYFQSKRAYVCATDERYAWPTITQQLLTWVTHDVEERRCMSTDS